MSFADLTYDTIGSLQNAIAEARKRMTPKKEREWAEAVKSANANGER